MSQRLCPPPCAHTTHQDEPPTQLVLFVAKGDGHLLQARARACHVCVCRRMCACHAEAGGMGCMQGKAAAHAHATSAAQALSRGLMRLRPAQWNNRGDGEQAGPTSSWSGRAKSKGTNADPSFLSTGKHCRWGMREQHTLHLFNRPPAAVATRACVGASGACVCACHAEAWGACRSRATQHHCAPPTSSTMMASSGPTTPRFAKKQSSLKPAVRDRDTILLWAGLGPHFSLRVANGSACGVGWGRVG